MAVPPPTPTPTPMTEGSISFAPYTPKALLYGETNILRVKTFPSDQPVVWSSSDTSVVTVNEGRVAAVGLGSATITAQITYGGKTYTDTCQVTVIAPE